MPLPQHGLYSAPISPDSATLPPSPQSTLLHCLPSKPNPTWAHYQDVLRIVCPSTEPPRGPPSLRACWRVPAFASKRPPRAAGTVLWESFDMIVWILECNLTTPRQFSFDILQVTFLKYQEYRCLFPSSLLLQNTKKEKSQKGAPFSFLNSRQKQIGRSSRSQIKDL
jgi:hypothetical protein